MKMCFANNIRIALAATGFYLAAAAINVSYFVINEFIFGYDEDYWMTATNPDGYDKYRKLVHSCGEIVDHGAFFGTKDQPAYSMTNIQKILKQLNLEHQSEFFIRNHSCKKGYCSIGIVQLGEPQEEKIQLLHDKIKQQNGKTGHISHSDTYVDYIDWNEGNVVCNRIGQKVLS